MIRLMCLMNEQQNGPGRSEKQKKAGKEQISSGLELFSGGDERI